VACAVGMTQEDVDKFLQKMDQLLKKQGKPEAKIGLEENVKA
jgi:hypothetical protein